MYTNKYNYGIAIMKIIMAYMVVACHFWNSPLNMGGGGADLEIEVRWILRLIDCIRRSSTSVFMLSSFYLLGDKMFKNDSRWFFNRIIRLLVPFVLWAIIYQLVNVFVVFVFGVERASEYGFNSDPQRLVLQILTGHSNCPPLWFIWDLIVLSVGSYIIVVFCRKNKRWVIGVSILFAIIAVILQYTGIYKKYVDSMPYNIRYPVGRLIEMIPLCTLGYLFYEKDILTWLQEKRWKCLFLLILLRISYSVDIHFIPEGYEYSGIGMIIEASCLFILFGSAKIENNTNNSKTYQIIKNISSICMGIYASHLLVGRVFVLLLNKGIMSEHTGWLTSLVFLMALLLSWLIYKVPGKLGKLLVT